MSNNLSIINYGLGNIQSLKNALYKCGYDAKVTNDISDIKNSQTILLPGVGNFGYAVDQLNKLKLKEAIIDHANKNKKIIAICLGMQLLLETSAENKEAKGLGIIKGSVKKLDEKKNLESLPHVSWKKIYLKEKNNMKLKNYKNKKFYFVHSYFCDVNQDNIYAETTYNDILFPSIISNKKCFGIQFHPEKSGQHGIDILNYFLKK